MQSADLFDMLILVCATLAFLALPVWLVQWIRYLKSRQKQPDGTYKCTRPFPAISTNFFLWPLLGIFAFSSNVVSGSQEEIQAYLAASDKIQITVDGKPVSNPAEIISALKNMTPMKSRQSHITDRILLVAKNQDASLTLNLGRDSEVPTDYWVFYPHYYFTTFNAVYLLHTSALQK